jgi:hypothetical protein
MLTAGTERDYQSDRITKRARGMSEEHKTAAELMPEGLSPSASTVLGCRSTISAEVHPKKGRETETDLAILFTVLKQERNM